MEPLNQQLAFILEVERLKGIYRQTTVKCDNDRRENSGEHSWHISLMAQLLSEYAEEPVNVQRAITMLLIHDVVEIDAGDLFAFAEPNRHEDQEDKELAAANRLFGMLPEGQFEEMKALWLEFEQAETTDARYAKAMDRILPLLQNMANEGGTWAKHNISRQRVLKRNEYLKGLTPKLWDYAVQQIDLAVEKGWLQP